MPTRSSNLWIERKDRPQYLSYTATATGLRVRYADRLDPLVVDNINALIAFLRKRFFFPVRCNIYVTNHKRYSSQTDGHLFYGIFYDNEKVCEKKYIYPQIFVAADLHRHLTVEDVMFTLLGTGGVDSALDIFHPKNIRTYLKTLSSDDNIRKILSDEFQNLIEAAKRTRAMMGEGRSEDLIPETTE